MAKAKNNVPSPIKVDGTLKTAEEMKNETVARETRLNVEVKGFKQTVRDDETGEVVKTLYYIKMFKGDMELQINVGEKTYIGVKTLIDLE